MEVENFWERLVRKNASLNYVDRISEVLFGLIMVLTFTGAISASTDDKQEVKELLWAALGCNLAWGLVDAIMYLMNVYLERGHALRVLNSLRRTKSKEEARTIFREEVSPFIIAILKDEEVDQLNERIQALPPPGLKYIFTVKDMVAAFQIFLLVFLCTFPVALPFAIVNELETAMRISNGIALLMLFAGGFILAGYAGFRKGITALLYMGIGLALVGLTIALGG